MKFKFLTLLIVVALLATSCGNTKKEDKPSSEPIKKETPKQNSASSKIDLTAPTLENKGIGPIKTIELTAIDDKLVAKGKELYKTNCTACHKFKKRYIGPGLKGVTERRSPEWIMNMILNTKEMLENDVVAKALIAEYNAPMAQQQLSKDDARAILEYFRTKN